MKIKIGDAISKNIKENQGVYFAVTLFFAIGIAAGAFTVRAFSQEQKQELVIYLNRFFQSINGEKVQNGKVFYQAMKNNFQTVFLIWLMGVTIIGVPFTLFITSFRGFIIGFTIAFLIQGLGWKGFLFILAAVFPQNIIYIPCLLIISAISLCYSMQAFKGKINKIQSGNIRNNITSYTTSILFFLIIMSIGCFIEAYISPYILKMLSSFMIS